MVLGKIKTDKKGFILGLLKIFLIIDVVIILLVIGAVVYAYNFVPIKTLNICTSNTTYLLPVNISCTTNEDCIDEITQASKSNASKESISESINNSELTEIGTDAIGNFIKTISEEVVVCIDKKCMTKGSDYEQILSSVEKEECSSDEEEKEIKITLSKIVPPSNILSLVRAVSKSSEIKTTIKEFIKTGSLPELEK